MNHRGALTLPPIPTWVEKYPTKADWEELLGKKMREEINHSYDVLKLHIKSNTQKSELVKYKSGNSEHGI